MAYLACPIFRQIEVANIKHLNVCRWLPCWNMVIIDDCIMLCWIEHVSANTKAEASWVLGWMFRPGQTHQALWKPQGVYARLVHFDGACCNCQECSAFVLLVGQALQKVEESMIIHTTQPIGGSSIGVSPRNPSCVSSWRYPNVGKRPTGMHWKHTMTWELISSLGCILAAWNSEPSSAALGNVASPIPEKSPLADLKQITRFAFKDSTSLCSWEKPCYPSSEIQHHTIFLFFFVVSRVARDIWHLLACMLISQANKQILASKNLPLAPGKAWGLMSSLGACHRGASDRMCKVVLPSDL